MVGLVVTDVVVVRVVVVGVEVCDVVTEVVVVPLVCVNVCVWCLCNEKVYLNVSTVCYCVRIAISVQKAKGVLNRLYEDMHMQLCSVAANNGKS